MYILYAFAPTSFLHARQDQTTLFLIITLVGVIGIASYQRKVFRRTIELLLRPNTEEGERARVLRRLHNIKRIQWYLLFLLVAADGLILEGLRIRAFVFGYARFAAVMFLIAFVVWRMKVRIEAYASWNMRTLVLLGGLGLVGPLWFFSALIFATRVYPNILFDRGGGNFCHAPLAAIRSSSKSESLNSRHQPPDWGVDLTPVMVIHETENYLYVADPFVKGAGPSEWRELSRLDNLEVKAISKAEVYGISYFESGCYFCEDFEDSRARKPCE